MFAKKISSKFVVAIVATALALSACLLLSAEAHAATNANATKALDSIQTQTYYKPGGTCPSGTNVGWLVNGSWNCENECYAFVMGVTTQLYGKHTFISGVGSPGYKANNAGSYNAVGTLVDTPSASPSLSSVQTLLNKAYPGDVIQFKGGPSSWGVPQHTAVVESVGSNGITVYQHLNSSHVSVNYFSWSDFYNKYLDFDAYTNYDKGITLYHYKNYDSKFDSHTCSFSVKGYAPRNDMNHHVYYNACSCGKTRSDGVAAHTFAWSGLSSVCTSCGRAETSHDTGYDYLAKKDLALYAESNWNNRVGTVPANTVLTPLSVEAGVGGGYWMAEVSYNGVTGWVTLADCMRNGNAGKHSFVDGFCSDCGMAESYSDIGVYKSSKSVTLYKSHPYAEDRKTVSAGTSITVSKVGITTAGYYWGYTPDGYVFSMDLLTDQVSTYPYNGTPTAVMEGQYIIHSAGDYNLVVDVSNASTAIRAVIQIYMENRSVAQRFDFISNEDGTYRIQNVNSGMVVEVKGWSKVNDAVIQQYTWSGDDNQRWYIEDNGDGTISFRNKISNLYLTVVDGTIVSGQDLQQHQPEGSASQRFMLECVDSSATPALTAYDTQIIGLEESYRFTGQAVEPKPVVRRLVWFADSLRVPNTGVGTHTHTNSISKPSLTQPVLEGGKTYVVEVDGVTALAGSFNQVSMMAYDADADKSLSPMYYFEVGVLETQSAIVEPTADGTLLFYCATNGTSLDCASLYEGIRVYEVLTEGADYELSYENNTSVGTASVTVTGIGSYWSAMNASFEIVEGDLLGDVYEDGNLDDQDLLLLQKYLTELVEFTPRQETLADVNADGAINMKDLIALAKAIVGTTAATD